VPMRNAWCGTVTGGQGFVLGTESLCVCSEGQVGKALRWKQTCRRGQARRAIGVLQEPGFFQVSGTHWSVSRTGSDLL
jgi:hypothetical protein